MVGPEYVDDDTIGPDDLLWRRVPDWPELIKRESTDRHRVTSAAFDDDADGDPMSVFLAAETSIDAVLEGHEGYGVVAITAGFVRGLPQRQIVFRSPHD